jgi:hypothetical protein
MCLGGACELSVLFALSRVSRVSFVCSLSLVDVFRGSLRVVCSFGSFGASFVCVCFPEYVLEGPL